MRVRDRTPMKSSWEMGVTFVLALAYYFGFASLNGAIGRLDVSLVMTLRAAEPLFTLALPATCLRVAPAAGYAKTLAALIPVVAGAALSAAAAADGDLIGVACCAASNMCFAVRGVLTKILRSEGPSQQCPFSLFMHLNIAGTAIAAVVLVSSPLTATALQQRLEYAILAGDSDGVDASGGSSWLPAWALLLVNGMSFWAYLQLSWLVLARVSAVCHTFSVQRNAPACYHLVWMDSVRQPNHSAQCAWNRSSLMWCLYLCLYTAEWKRERTHLELEQACLLKQHPLAQMAPASRQSAKQTACCLGFVLLWNGRKPEGTAPAIRTWCGNGAVGGAGMVREWCGGWCGGGAGVVR